MNDSRSWAQASRYYEQLKVVVDMKSPSHDLKDLDAKNNCGWHERLWILHSGL